MRHEMKGFSRVFSFTFVQHWKEKSFLRATVIVAALCLLLPAVILPLVVLWGDGEETPESVVSSLERVYVLDMTSIPETDLSFLNLLAAGGDFSALTYRSFGQDIHAALDATASDGGRSLILCLEERDGDPVARVLLPEETDLEEGDVAAYTRFINGSLPYIWAFKMGMDPARLMELYAGVEIAPHNGAMIEDPGMGEDPHAEMVTPQEKTRQMLAMILPYCNIMLLYFMVLFYGQSVANSVISEKTSKLVDTFLVAVRPAAMVMGKLLAIAASGVLQLLLWLSALLGGFGIGAALVRAISPDSSMGLMLLIDQLELWSGMFSLPTVLISVLMLCSGFLLYCALAAIGGSMASKPEELPATNSLFSMVLIVSFLCTLYAGGMSAGMSSSEIWLNWVPFTAIFVVPSRVMIGEMTVGGALLSLALVIVVAFLLVLLAGRVYRMLILYKGKTLKPGDVLKMLGNRS